MHAVVFKHTEEFKRIEVRDRFDFEDRFLNSLVPLIPARNTGNTIRAHRGFVYFFIP